MTGAMITRTDDQDYRRTTNKQAAWYRKAAEAGNADGMRNLGYMYYYGLGMAVDYQRAVYWYLRSAEAGNALGMAFLGDMYKNGTGVDKDPKQALGWFHKAAEANEPYAMNDLGEMYEYGHGVKADREQAIDWYRKAAKLGNQDAVANLKRLKCKFEIRVFRTVTRLFTPPLKHQTPIRPAEAEGIGHGVVHVDFTGGVGDEI